MFNERVCICEKENLSIKGFSIRFCFSSLPVLAHNSGVMYGSFCNCGRRQGQREDSFSIKAANYTFYCQLAENCCSRLDSIQFPTFKPSVTDAKGMLSLLFCHYKNTNLLVIIAHIFIGTRVRLNFFFVRGSMV